VLSTAGSGYGEAMADRERKLVVAGLIGGRDGRLLITRRRADHAMPLLWEFPGGKVEPGESPAQALVRELLEELGARVEVGRIWEVLFHSYPEFDLVMLVYGCRLAPGEIPRCVEVDSMADRGLLARLRDEGAPPIFEKSPAR
jgi:mutator protein MutT